MNELTPMERDMLNDVIGRRFIGNMDWEKRTLESLQRWGLVEKIEDQWLPTSAAYSVVLSSREVAA